MALNVTENEDGSLTIDWDEEDEAVFKDFTAEDFINLIRNYAEEAKRVAEESDDNQREEVTYYLNSESEGKEYKDYDERYDQYISARDSYIQATNEETYGVNPETFGQAYHSPEAQGSWD